MYTVSNSLHILPAETFNYVVKNKLVSEINKVNLFSLTSHVHVTLHFIFLQRYLQSLWNTLSLVD